MRNSIFLILVICSIAACNQQAEEPSPISNSYYQLQGLTMGTSYLIIFDGDTSGLRSEVDSLLLKVNEALSTYDSISVINYFNSTLCDQGLFYTSNPHFVQVMQASFEVYEKSNGVFNPAIGPLVNYYGFGSSEKTNIVDSNEVETLLSFLDFESIIDTFSWRRYEADSFFGNGEFIGVFETMRAPCKSEPQQYIDLSAIAKGYGVDMVAKLLEARGVENYFVEIGGEIRIHGVNPDHMPWRIGINTPDASASPDQYSAVAKLNQGSVATSGNYRQTTTIEGVKVAHIIDPRTGYPGFSDVLSATVIADECMLADAYATVLTIVGFEEASAMINLNPEIEGILITDQNEIWVSDGIKEIVEY